MNRPPNRTLADYGTALQAAVLLVVVRVGLAVVPFRTLEARLHSRQRGRRESQGLTATHRRTLWAVSAVARRLFGNKPCLPQALVARLLLERQGVHTDLKIGVAKEDGSDLLAHAWLERDGRVLIGGQTSPQQYRVLEPVNRLAA